MLAGTGWGAVAASSLVLGALLAVLRPWPSRWVGLVLGVGAGALIASVSFELAEEGLRIAGAGAVAAGLAVGALAYDLADRAVTRWADRRGGGAAGAPLALGALLDGSPEQAVLGIGLAAGEGVGVALLVAIFVSNLPEAIGSSADMLQAGRSRRDVLGLWAGVAAVCTLATVAGALLVMLIDSMVPEAQQRARDLAGLATVVGFAAAAGLSLLG